MALPGFAEFQGNCTKIGVSPAEALGFWKGCMDQLKYIPGGAILLSDKPSRPTTLSKCGFARRQLAVER